MNDWFSMAPDADTWSVSEILDHPAAPERRVTGLFANGSYSSRVMKIGIASSSSDSARLCTCSR